ncbi:hypothetical protein SIN07_03015 [Pediococcus inopinatus]|uniref:Uncharacterized protein n=1 Tax=Pediococcus inopinatus TaxID=114090 RepID=A0ABZ0Q2P4_9LACO|nr:hypothetical protein [Pediococcus inopinatus]AVL00324.1 hypothetical protein PI20285_06580 [Pediococcus inopinatus]WPC17986.1 hypothetical protein N6G94_02965 [Pediococcus inopinatus]WPC21235.1 hypothetical protein N6G96_08100 [Pediococcus inopinatus]WPP09838.1 hypothetical protein SIN07_03015 [Pediococcus inopinatus]
MANGDVKLRVLGIDEYVGGTGLIKFRLAQRYSKDQLAIFKILVNKSKKDYLLDANAVSISGNGKNQIVGYKIKKMPKQIKDLTIESSLDKPEVTSRTSLKKIPMTVKAKRSNSVYKFKKAVLQNGKLTVRYEFTGMDGSVHDFLKNNNVVSGFAIMAKTYQDNGNDSVFGKDYLDKSKH